MKYNWRNEGFVKEATKSGSRWRITTTSSTGFSVEFIGEVREGQEVELAIQGASYVVGVKLDGLIIMLKTEEDIARERKEWKIKYAQQKLDKYNLSKEMWLLDIANLPTPLKIRMNRIIQDHGGFKPAFLDGADYELFCCVEASKLIEYFKTLFAEKGITGECDEATTIYKEHVHGFNDHPDMPKMSENHRGNTHGGSIYLAVCIALGIAL